jgi:hypothetical protein
MSVDNLPISTKSKKGNSSIETLFAAGHGMRRVDHAINLPIQTGIVSTIND